MKVCILGSGIAGMICALECEKRGITVEVYEKKMNIGGDIESGVLISSKEKKYIENGLGFKIEYLNKINKMKMINNDVVKRKRVNTAYVIKQGVGFNSFERQIANKLKCKIHLGKYLTIKEAKKAYDFVIDARDTNEFAYKNNMFEPKGNVYLRICTVIGKFDRKKIQYWYDNKLYEDEYGYLFPFIDRKASLFLVSQSDSKLKLESAWQKYINNIKEKMYVNISSDITLCKGNLTSYSKDNVKLIGRAAGIFDTLSGIGIKETFDSGVLAVKSIVDNVNFDDALKNNIYESCGFIKFH